jgi:elongation factor 2 kinase
MVEFLNEEEKGQFGSLERYLPGNYEKHSTANPILPFALNDRNTPQAFSHFTFEQSGGKELVVDVQGVGDVYTDPQVRLSQDECPVYG